MTKSNLEQLLEKYSMEALNDESRVKLLRWFETMERAQVSGFSFSRPDDERLYKLLVSKKSTLEDIDAFRPYSFDPPSPFSNPWVQFALTVASIATLIGLTLWLRP